MKLLDNNGQFTFITRGQVKIDKDLPKYKNLSTKVTQETTEPSMLGEAEKTDSLLRKKILEIPSERLQEYLLSETASEVNSYLSEVLLREVNINHWSISGVGYDNLIPIPGFSKKPSKLKRLWKFIKELWKEKSTEDPHKEGLMVIDFFKDLKLELSQEEEFISRISGYLKLIQGASSMGQTAQLDILTQGILINIYESILYVNDLKNFISFDRLATLKKPGEKVIDIDYVENFSRIIPKEVVEKKLKADSLMVFDNYCVMYYDPQGETYKKTSTARRDPILFGLINHSEKLYYIDSWEDEYCDLTIEDIAEVVDELKEV